MDRSLVIIVSRYHLNRHITPNAEYISTERHDDSSICLHTSTAAMTVCQTRQLAEQSADCCIDI